MFKEILTIQLTSVFLDFSSTNSLVPFLVCVRWKTSSTNTNRPSSFAFNTFLQT